MMKKMLLVWIRATIMLKGKIYLPLPGLLGNDDGQEVQVGQHTAPDGPASSTRSEN